VVDQKHTQQRKGQNVIKKDARVMFYYRIESGGALGICSSIGIGGP
jgi:hypothetical protein